MGDNVAILIKLLFLLSRNPATFRWEVFFVVDDGGVVWDHGLDSHDTMKVAIKCSHLHHSHGNHTNKEMNQ